MVPLEIFPPFIREIHCTRMCGRSRFVNHALRTHSCYPKGRILLVVHTRSLLVASGGQCSDNGSAFQAAELQGVICVPLSVLVMTVVYQFGGKVRPKKVDRVIRSEKGKDLNIIKGFEFRFQNILAENMEQWCCSNTRSVNKVK